jgi:hypothetical protein
MPKETVMLNYLIIGQVIKYKEDHSESINSDVLDEDES